MGHSVASHSASLSSRMRPAVLVLAVLCGIRAANRDDNWVEAGTPRAQDDATQQTETAVTQIINQNTVRPNTQSVAYSTITGQPDSNPALADEEYQSLKQRVIRANHTSFSQLFDAIRDTCSEALAPFEKKVQTAPVTAGEELLDVGWGESLDHNYEKMAQAGNAQFEKYFNRQVSALKKACQLRIEEAKAGDFIQLHSSVTPVASWVQYHAGAVSELWIRLEDNSKQALKLATKAKQLRAKLDKIKKNALKEALIQLQKDWQGKFEQLKMRFDQQCRMKVLATQMNAKGNERAAKAH